MSGWWRRRLNSRAPRIRSRSPRPCACATSASSRYAVSGTPTDCVMMGVRILLKDQPPDLVLSGVNRGSNLADDVTYSGTIAGAMEGSLLGIPSIALSLAIGNDETGKLDLGHAQAPWRRTVAQAGQGRLAGRHLDQRQFSDLPPGAVKGVSVPAGPAHSGSCASTSASMHAGSRITGSASPPQSHAADRQRSGRCSPGASR